MSRNDMIEIACICERETDLAVLLNDGTRSEWFPKSQLESWPDEGEDGIAEIPEWLAEDKEFI